ncbi:MAG TPA: immunity protein Tsi6 family protein [Rhodanobacter sp.]|nr:immunity protein Tsi6 family protein [Rhodanobacter sp.]
MIGREEALNSIRKARALLAGRMRKNAGYGVYLHASEQLERMADELGQPGPAPAASRRWVDIGLMAVRELEASDSELANAPMEADHDFRHAR